MLKLTRPLVVFDIETTGLEIGHDRVVQLGAMKHLPGQIDAVTYSALINPGMPIPEAATKVHGITDDDVRGRPLGFAAFGQFLEFIGDADLAGYNCDGFDVPFLEADMHRCGHDLRVERRRIVDVYKLWQRLEPRKLENAVQHFCDRPFTDAHDAMDDTAATSDVLEAIIGKHMISGDPADLEALMIPEGALDRDGKVVIEDDNPVLTFGKHQGKPLIAIPTDYLEWALGQSFHKSTKDVFTDELKRRRQGRVEV